MDVVSIQSNSRAESCANANIWWNVLSHRGEERTWRERRGKTGGEMLFCFFFSLRTCVTARRESVCVCVSAVLTGGTLEITYISGADANTHGLKNGLSAAAM